ncbi:cysteine proteinase [Wolfiporia cocos MD-104 SS10]|uniref:Cysteine proteinase n=1 Tax=Wolfiporia cocos (strain MD-104) TaxID=742152 RepID=A0A2H3J6Z9_WOLCO|nr:cysteine proteinase [Wolfiporia cocos MD-104 SS10]
MNVRKRQATDALEPVRATKQRRLHKDYYRGQHSSPTHREGLGARWARLGMEFYKLVRDTWSSWLEEPRETDLISEPPESRENTPPPASRRPVAPLPIRRHPQYLDVDQYQYPDTYSGYSQSAPVEPTLTSIASLPNKFYLAATITDFPGALRPKAELPKPRTPSPSPEPEESPQSSSRNFSHYSFLPGMGKDKWVFTERKSIFHKKHEQWLKEVRQKDLEEMSRQLYDIKKSREGYSSDYKTFEEFLAYQLRVEAQVKSASFSDLRELQRVSTVPGQTSSQDLVQRALERAKASLAEPRPKAVAPSFEKLVQSQRVKDKEIDDRLHPKAPPIPTSLPEDDEQTVDELFKKRGIISKTAREQVSADDIARLKPRVWLNDEIINFYGQLILDRAEAMKENTDTNAPKPLKVHLFNTFFWSKLQGQGYEKARLAKWTKRIDIFDKDIVLIPVNHDNTHWTAAAINFKKKRIESYDSMGYIRHNVFKLLRQYLDDEHRNKKKAPFDFTGWVDHTMEDIPLQENAFDCGVFTCQFLEALSRGEETFRFKQIDMPYLRRRMVWEIGHAKLRDDV